MANWIKRHRRSQQRFPSVQTVRTDAACSRESITTHLSFKPTLGLITVGCKLDPHTCWPVKNAAYKHQKYPKTGSEHRRLRLGPRPLVVTPRDHGNHTLAVKCTTFSVYGWGSGLTRSETETLNQQTSPMHSLFRTLNAETLLFMGCPRKRGPITPLEHHRR